MSRTATTTRRKPAKARAAARPAPVVKAVPAAAAPEPIEAPELPAPAIDTAAAAAADAPAPAAAEPRRVSTARVGLRLESSCLLRDALDMQFQLLSADFGEGDVMVDGSTVERVDTAGLQLLLAFVNEHEQKGRHVGWTASSDELRRAAARLGLTHHLRLPAGEAAP